MATDSRGAAGNVVAGIASFFLPGLGQLVQGRFGMAVLHFFGAMALWIITLGLLGWVMHLVSAFGAATWKPK